MLDIWAKRHSLGTNSFAGRTNANGKEKQQQKKQKTKGQQTIIPLHHALIDHIGVTGFRHHYCILSCEKKPIYVRVAQAIFHILASIWLKRSSSVKTNIAHQWPAFLDFIRHGNWSSEAISKSACVDCVPINCFAFQLPADSTASHQASSLSRKPQQEAPMTSMN